MFIKLVAAALPDSLINCNSVSMYFHVWDLCHLHAVHVRFSAALWTVAHQAPLSMGFSRQEHWSGLPRPPPGDLPHPGIEPASPVFQVDSLLLNHQGSPISSANNMYFLLSSSDWLMYLFSTSNTIMDRSSNNVKTCLIFDFRGKALNVSLLIIVFAIDFYF